MKAFFVKLTSKIFQLFCLYPYCNSQIIQRRLSWFYSCGA